MDAGETRKCAKEFNHHFGKDITAEKEAYQQPFSDMVIGNEERSIGRRSKEENRVLEKDPVGHGPPRWDLGL